MLLLFLVLVYLFKLLNNLQESYKVIARVVLRSNQSVYPGLIITKQT